MCITSLPLSPPILPRIFLVSMRRSGGVPGPVNRRQKYPFFDDADVLFCNTQVCHSDGEKIIRLLSSSPTVDVVIGNLLFHPKDMEGVSSARGLTLFTLVEHAEPEDVPAHGILSHVEYVAENNTSRYFNLPVTIITCRALFRMVDCLMQYTREEC